MALREERGEGAPSEAEAGGTARPTLGPWVMVGAAVLAGGLLGWATAAKKS